MSPAENGCLKQLVAAEAGASDHEDVIDPFFDLADAIIAARRLIREARTLYRRDRRPLRRP